MDCLARVNVDQLLSGPVVPLTLFLTFGSVVCVISIVARQWRRVRLGEAEVSLKGRMVERGYSADEIERVCQIGIQSAPPERPRRGARHANKSFLT